MSPNLASSGSEMKRQCLSPGGQLLHFYMARQMFASDAPVFKNEPVMWSPIIPGRHPGTHSLHLRWF